MGPGTYTSMTQVAAEFLGSPPEQVRLRLGTTAYPPTPSQGGSWTMASVGSAIRAACLEAKLEATKRAIADQGSPVFGASMEAVEWAEGRAAPARRYLAAGALLPGHPDKGRRARRDCTWHQRREGAQRVTLTLSPALTPTRGTVLGPESTLTFPVTTARAASTGKTPTNVVALASAPRSRSASNSSGARLVGVPVPTSSDRTIDEPQAVRNCRRGPDNRFSRPCQ